jgi:hypothetical protein
MIICVRWFDKMHALSIIGREVQWLNGLTLCPCFSVCDGARGSQFVTVPVLLGL